MKSPNLNILSLLNEGIESLKGRVQASSTELENHQKEFERIKASHSEQLKTQVNNFQKREDQQLKEFNKKILYWSFY